MDLVFQLSTNILPLNEKIDSYILFRIALVLQIATVKYW
jgi:hypothetical protein